MDMTWASAGTADLAAFLASLVEFVEALTVVLAVGSVRGWRSALTGSAAAVAVLAALIAILGSTLARAPIGLLQVVVGSLLLLFGLKWLRKAVLRAAGVIPLHDETAVFGAQTEALRRLGGGGGWDRIALTTAFQITLLEGAEVVFIVLAVGAGGTDLILPASLGALAALLVVIALGLAIRRPLATVPENALKFAVGVLLAAFGAFWLGEGVGLGWPGGDWSIPVLVAGFLAGGLAAVPLCRRRAARAAGSGR